ncbi:hypothetical protein [Deinococcus maricopensis]|uniref:DUF306 domain-containing protein n=1 Tax=Deinococcus maricopensis (strain DSM 21211 / LMG 22137 / NRRL B-23946 / LB-34) TaxID=709986 RepID=E8U8F4_DEIML|nr:hypothetical protein [Deinococcus maricopensis]ADV67343.1 hypothetical protein Deima_1694 [Deinococcus maricopensis DSM 21211]
MRRAALLLLLTLSPALAAPNYTGAWTFTARGEDGTVLTQKARITQVVRGGRVYLSGYGLSGALRGSTGAFSSVSRDADATRTYAGTLTFSVRSARGSGTLKEAYRGGRVIVTHFSITGRR